MCMWYMHIRADLHVTSQITTESHPASILEFDYVNAFQVPKWLKSKPNSVCYTALSNEDETQSKS